MGRYSASSQHPQARESTATVVDQLIQARHLLPLGGGIDIRAHAIDCQSTGPNPLCTSVHGGAGDMDRFVVPDGGPG